MLPDFVGGRIESAQRQARRLRLQLIQGEEASRERPGTVLSQDPAAGASVERRTIVYVVVAAPASEVDEGENEEAPEKEAARSGEAPSKFTGVHEDRRPPPRGSAHFEPVVDSSRRELLVELQRLHRIDEELYLARPIAPEHGVYQIQWTAPVESWLERVEFDREGIARRMHPMGAGDPVIIDPEVTFGIPQVRGIRTETLAEAYATTRLSVEEMASQWDLEADEIEAALRWELNLREAA